MKTKSNLDTKWSKRMIIRCLKVLHLSHPRNPINSLLLGIPTRFFTTVKEISASSIKKKSGSSFIYLGGLGGREINGRNKQK
jgi:hypothetical protein